MARPPKKSKGPVDLSVLTAEDRKRIREEARIKVEAELKVAAEDAFLETAMDDVRQEMNPQAIHETRFIIIDLAGHSDRITLDGMPYFHGMPCTVPKPVYDVLMEQTTRGWKHEREIGGANANAYQSPREITVSAKTGITGAENLARTVQGLNF